MSYVPVLNGASQPVLLLQPSVNYGGGGMVPQMALSPQMPTINPGTYSSTNIIPSLAPQQFAFAPTLGLGGGGLPSISPTPMMGFDPTGGLMGSMSGLAGLGYGGGMTGGIGSPLMMGGGLPGLGIAGVGAPQAALSPFGGGGGIGGAGGSSSIVSLLLTLLLSNGGLLGGQGGQGGQAGGLLQSLLGALTGQQGAFGQGQQGFGGPSFGGPPNFAQAGGFGGGGQAPNFPPDQQQAVAPQPFYGPPPPQQYYGPQRPPASYYPPNTQVNGNRNVVQNPQTTVWGNNNRVVNNYYYFANPATARAYWDGRDRYNNPPPYFADNNFDGPVIGGGATATVMGDPHFDGFEKDKFDVMGQVGKTYNILSDNDLQFNAKFGAYKGQNDATIMDEAGILVGNDRIHYGLTGDPTLNDQAIEKGRTYNLQRGSVQWDGTALNVQNGEYDLKLDRVNNEYLNYTAKIKDKGVNSDGVMPHGLLGQTADGDGKARMGKTGKGAQGEGAIDGSVKDYEVSSIYATDDKYNRYGVGQTNQASTGVNANQGAQGTPPADNNGQGGGNNGGGNNGGGNNQNNNQNGGQPPQG